MGIEGMKEALKCVRNYEDRMYLSFRIKVMERNQAAYLERCRPRTTAEISESFSEKGVDRDW